MTGTTYFSKSWLNGKYKDWIIENPLDYKTFKCKLCNPCKVVNLSNMGANALISHIKSEKHKRSIKVKSFFKPKNIPPKSIMSSLDAETNVTETSPAETSSTINKYLTSDSVRHAEIKWALIVVMKNLSLRSCTAISSLFEVIFPDSKIAKEFSLDKDKCAYTYYGIAPHFENILISEVQPSDVYSINKYGNSEGTDGLRRNILL